MGKGSARWTHQGIELTRDRTIMKKDGEMEMRERVRYWLYREGKIYRQKLKPKQA